MSPSCKGVLCRPPLGARLDSMWLAKFQEQKAGQRQPSLVRSGSDSGLPWWEAKAPWAPGEASLESDVVQAHVAQAHRSGDRHAQHSPQIGGAQVVLSGGVHGVKTSDTMVFLGCGVDDAVTECPSEKCSFYMTEDLSENCSVDSLDMDDELIESLPISTCTPIQPCSVHVRHKVAVEQVEDASVFSMCACASDRVLKLSL
mmetsp:Transcript_179331/g.569013  ORF Transcript_179331/g.569013 Transcript_179331/m.569013 type:complete len:201 (-) Transcript_179331:100-702(-)